MAAHAHLKNEFTEDEKSHNLVSWLKFINGAVIPKDFEWQGGHFLLKFYQWCSAHDFPPIQSKWIKPDKQNIPGPLT